MSLSNPNQELRRLRRWYSFCGWVCAIYFINFFAFVAVASYLGGDAVNGKVENGHYYLFGYIYHLGGKGYTEVTRGMFTYSKWHAYSVITTVFLCMIAAFIGNKLKARISALESGYHLPKGAQTESKGAI